MLIFLFLGMSEGTSQVAKGTIRLGPSLAYTSQTNKEVGSYTKNKISTLELGLFGGYFVIDNLEVALGVTLARTNQEERTIGRTAIGPQVTYMVPIGEKFYLPISGGIAYNSLTYDEGNYYNESYSGLGYGVGMGVEYLVSNKIGARFSLTFSAGSVSDNDNSDITVNIKNTFAGIGFNIYLER